MCDLFLVLKEKNVGSDVRIFVKNKNIPTRGSFKVKTSGFFHRIQLSQGCTIF